MNLDPRAPSQKPCDPSAVSVEPAEGEHPNSHENERSSRPDAPELIVAQKRRPQAGDRSSSQRFWRRIPLLQKIVVVYITIGALMGLGSGIVIILNARAATSMEMKASLEIAERYIKESIRAIAPETQGKALAERIPIQLKYLRHVRILIVDPSGTMTLVSKTPETAGEQAHSPLENVPRWFTRLIEPATESRQIITMLGDFRLGTILIVGEPADEIAEVWEDISSLALVGLVVGGVGLAALMLILRRVLRPLTNLSQGLAELEQFRYGLKLPIPDTRETAIIATRFNALAEALEGAHIENRRLYQHLLSVQEAERHIIATELHDEAGPCLFSLQASASLIQKLAQRGESANAPALAGRAATMLEVVARLQRLNRALLVKLRPVALGRVSLSDLLSDLVDDFSRQYEEVTFSFLDDGLQHSYGEMSDIAVYRFVQEGIANAMRHGQPRRVTVRAVHRKSETGTNTTERRLEIAIEDDGAGIAAGTAFGFGLKSLRERLATLSGTCALEPGVHGGTVLRAIIPINAAPAPHLPA